MQRIVESLYGTPGTNRTLYVHDTGRKTTNLIKRKTRSKNRKWLNFNTSNSRFPIVSFDTALNLTWSPDTSFKKINKNNQLNSGKLKSFLFKEKKNSNIFIFPHISHGVCVLNRTKITQLKFYFENEKPYWNIYLRGDKVNVIISRKCLIKGKIRLSF